MVSTRQAIAEGIKALVVIALLFLSFGHKPVEPTFTNGAALGIYTLADGTVPIFCGQAGPDGDQGDHNVCHACKIGSGLNLSPAPCVAEPAFAAFNFVAYVPRAAAPSAAAPTPPSGARAPPVV